MKEMNEEEHLREIDRPIYEEELAPHLPERIFDAHVHLMRRSDYLPGIVPEDLETTAPAPLTEDFTYEDLDSTMGRLFPGRGWEAMIFHHPSPHVDLERGNAWIAELGRRHENVHPLFIPTPDMPAEALEENLREGGFVGLKPYLAFAPTPESGEVRIGGFLTDAHLEVVARLGLLVVLHVPRRGRIGDPVNIEDVAEVCTRFPEARIILAHVGRSYGPYFIEQAIDTFRGLPNLYYDVAALDDVETVEVVLSNVPHTRMLFASDLPVTLLRGRHLCVNRHCFFLTEEPCPNSIAPPPKARFPMTFMLYETVRAVLRACRKLGLGGEVVEDIFYNNAARLVEQAGRS